METELVLGIVSVILLAASSGFLGLLTFLMLKSSLRPKLRVTVRLKRPNEDEDEEDKCGFHEGKLQLTKKDLEYIERKTSQEQPCTLRFRLENVGYWYGARPAA